MMMPCESIVKVVLPAIRAGVIKKLYKDKKMSQVEIAEKLGITQAAVSKYLSGNYSKKLKELEKTEEIQENINNIYESIVSGKARFEKSVCEYCGHSEVCAINTGE
jgi:predicted transcriptional regulator